MCMYMQIRNAIVCLYNPTHPLPFPHYPDYAMLLLTVYDYENAKGQKQSWVLDIRMNL